MKTNQNTERVYELLEQFDFNQLSEQDRIYIVSIMSEADYIGMRDALKDTQDFFASALEPNSNDSLQTLVVSKSKNENWITKFLKLPIQLYKVAALILIVLGIYSVIHYSYPKEKISLSALRDTIAMNKADTVFSRNEYDCDKEICPNNIDKIKELVVNNNVSSDTLLKDFIVSVN